MEILRHTYRVVSFDLHGFGSAPPLKTEMTVERYADEIAQLLKHLRIDLCITVGLSLGGYLTFALFKKYPAIFKGMILANTRAPADTEEGKANRLKQAQQIRAGGIKEFREVLIEQLIGEHTSYNRRPVVLSIRALMEQASIEGTAGMLETISTRPDSTDLLPLINIPVCIIVGEEDKIISFSDAQKMKDAIPKAELHVIKQAGHLSNLEDPQSFTSIVKNFCDGVTSKDQLHVSN